MQFSLVTAYLPTDYVWAILIRDMIMCQLVDDLQPNPSCLAEPLHVRMFLGQVDRRYLAGSYDSQPDEVVIGL